MSLAAALLIAGCAAEPTRIPSDPMSSITQADVDRDRIRWQCVAIEASKMVADRGALSVDVEGEKEIGLAALQKCTTPEDDRFADGKIDAMRAQALATQASSDQIQEMARVASQQRAEKAKQDEAALEAAEPTVTAAWRNCLLNSAKALALSTTEAAETVAKVSLVACKRQEDDLEKLHTKYGDPSFAWELAPKLENAALSPLMFRIMAERAKQREAPARQPKDNASPI